MITLEDKKKLKKQINGKFNNMGSADENTLKKYHCRNFFLCPKLKSRVSFIQLMPVLDISLRGFSLSSCPHHSLNALLL
jgi:transcription initiation factor IIE alpha subunit